MMAKKEEVVTPKFRVSFANVWQPRKDSGKYTLSMMFTLDQDISKLKSMFEATAKQAFGGLKGIKSPFKSGDEKAANWDRDCVEGEEGKYDNLKGHTILDAGTKFQPAIIDASREVIFDEAEFYSGCFARTKVSAYSWEYQGKRGVSFNLGNIQKMADGEKFGKSRNPADDFDTVEMVDETDI